MKKQLLSLAALVLTAAAFGQAENDDMYFNSKDRAQLKAQRASDEAAYTAMASAKKTKKADKAVQEEVVNPTDSYSARNVNPEFAARSNSQTAAADNQDYFVNNYRYNTSTNLNAWNNGFNGWYNNSWYTANYSSPYIYNWNSSYYGSGYDAWGNPWCNPYYNSGYSSSFSYYWGGSWNYGWGGGIGMSYGYGNPYYNPYSGWGAWGYSGFGYPYYGGGYYPGNIVIVNNNYGENGRKVVYGKRASHGAMVTSPQDASYTRTRSSYTSASRPDVSGGRVSTSATTERQADYYNRSWRNSQQSSYSNPTRSTSTRGSSSYDPWSGNTSRFGGDTNSYHGSGSSRSSSFDGGGGGGGSRSAAPASSGSNGRTRGRD